MLKDRDTRYRVVRHTLADVAAAQAGEDVLLTGDITTRNVPNAQFCLAFTIHSFQGKTFTGRRLWIDARRVWDYAMLYTAISRCRSLEQIRIMFE
jgi:ATP-dependent exoDNAse (exonuclease V) alpha subunit